MLKTVLTIVVVMVVFGFLYWWFIPWRPVLNSYKISGIKEINPPPQTLHKKGQRILAVTAHIDDIEFFSGGTMAYLQEGDAVAWLVIGTEDYKWYYSTKEGSEKHTEKRKQEQKRVTKYLGYDKVLYLGYPDFRLKADSESIKNVAEIIEAFKPDAILTFDPVKGSFVQHRDHKEAGIIALEAAKISKTKAPIFMFNTSKPNFYLNVSSTINRKWRALEMFNSVFKKNNRMFGMLKRWARDAGKKAGVRYAESYRVVRFR